MKRIGWIFSVLAVLSFAACNNASESAPKGEETQTTEATDEKEPATESGIVSPSVFGEEVTVEKVTSSDELFAALATTDTVKDIVVSGKINKCCQKKGCWMKVDLGNEKEVFVKFQDYGFFMPLDCSGSTAIMQGMAYSDTVSVEDLKHYAEDAGKSEEEIAAITEPEVKYSFMASGVILKDYVRSEKGAEKPAEASEEEM